MRRYMMEATFPLEDLQLLGISRSPESSQNLESGDGSPASQYDPISTAETEFTTQLFPLNSYPH
jgi:hypothetical protein